MKNSNVRLVMQNGDVVTLVDGLVMRNDDPFDWPPTPRALVVVQIGRRVYQLGVDRIWFKWSGRHGWRCVHSKKKLLKLKKFTPELSI